MFCQFTLSEDEDSHTVRKVVLAFTISSRLQLHVVLQKNLNDAAEGEIYFVSNEHPIKIPQQYWVELREQFEEVGGLYTQDDLLVLRINKGMALYKIMSVDKRCSCTLDDVSLALAEGCRCTLDDILLFVSCWHITLCSFCSRMINVNVSYRF